MAAQRVKINLTFEADLDPVPGWGNKPEDWADYVKDRLSGNGHYHPITTVLSVERIGPEDPMALLVSMYRALHP